jgi:hypothetical protein
MMSGFVYSPEMEVERLRQSSAIQKWLGALAPSTREVCFRVYLRWHTWLRDHDKVLGGLSPDELIERQATANGRGMYEVLDALQRYVSSFEGRYSYKRKIVAYIRSFYQHNRVALPPDPSMNIRAERPPVQGRLTPENVRLMILGMPPVYQAVFTCMFQAALDLEGFTYWNSHGWPRLKEDLERGVEPIRIDLIGRKKMKNIAPYYTYLGGDAIDAIKRYLPHRTKGASAIFVGQRGQPLTKPALQTAWLRRARRLGLVPPQPHETRGPGEPQRADVWARYGFNVHELRDCWRTLLAKSDVKADACEFWMGHVVDSLGYNKIGMDEETMRAEYLKGEPFINLFSSGLPFRMVNETRVLELERQLEEQRRTIELMMPAFSLVQKMLDERKEWEKLRGPS